MFGPLSLPPLPPLVDATPLPKTAHTELPPLKVLAQKAHFNPYTLWGTAPFIIYPHAPARTRASNRRQLRAAALCRCVPVAVAVAVRPLSCGWQPHALLN